MSSYADVAASGPKQSPEEAAAPQLPQVESSEYASTASLVDVDTPSVRTVPSDFMEQEVQTETQAARLEREEETARAEADLSKKKAASKARKANDALTKWFAGLSDNARTGMVASNILAVVGLGGFLGYKAWTLYDHGRFSWKTAGIGAGIVGAVGLFETFLGGYLYKSKKKSS